MRSCPECAELIQNDAKVCRFCGRQFSKAELHRIRTGETSTPIWFGAGVVVALAVVFQSTKGSDTPSAKDLPAPAASPAQKVFQDSHADCVARGIAYFKEIEAYPFLRSTGESADEVAKERCSRTLTAF